MARAGSRGQGTGRGRPGKSQPKSQRSPKEPEPVGGAGAEPVPTHAEVLLFERAFLKEWPVPHATRTSGIKRLGRCFDYDQAGVPLAGNAKAIAAFRALVAATRANIAREQAELNREEFQFRQECVKLQTTITTDAVEYLEAGAADRMLKALLDESGDDNPGHNGF